eukprot:scaffold17701_cov113-Isochrysis_galbana.AAC.5
MALPTQNADMPTCSCSVLVLVGLVELVIRRRKLKTETAMFTAPSSSRERRGRCWMEAQPAGARGGARACPVWMAARIRIGEDR